jgi:hypothetical protein
VVSCSEYCSEFSPILTSRITASTGSAHALAYAPNAKIGITNSAARTPTIAKIRETANSWSARPMPLYQA